MDYLNAVFASSQKFFHSFKIQVVGIVRYINPKSDAEAAIFFCQLILLINPSKYLDCFDGGELLSSIASKRMLGVFAKFFYLIGASQSIMFPSLLKNSPVRINLGSDV